MSPAAGSLTQSGANDQTKSGTATFKRSEHPIVGGTVLRGDVMRYGCPLLMSWIVTPSCYRLGVCTSMVTTTAARTKTTTMARASIDPMAWLSLRPAMFPNVKSLGGPSRATNRIGSSHQILVPSESVGNRRDRATALI